MRKELTAALGAALILTATPALPESGVVGAYGADELMIPCQEGDNDSRSGSVAETECEQYIMGFADALNQAGMVGSGKQICPPAQNAADEMRWAFVKWVNQDYSVRMKMSAGEALMSMLRESFPCSG